MAHLPPDQYAEMRTELAELKRSIEVKTEPLVWPLQSEAQLEEKYASLHEGLDKRKQRLWRRQIHHLVGKAGQQLGLPQWSIGNALMLCHKFYTMYSMKKNDRFTIAAACLHIAAKFDNSPKPIDKVVPICLRYMRGWSDHDQQTPAAQADIEQFKEEVLAAERTVLYGLNFNLHTPLIYVFLVQLVSKLAEKDHQFHALMQHTWNFINDSFCSTLCLQYPLEKIVGTALYVSNQINVRAHGSSGDIMPLISSIMGHHQPDFFTVFNMTLEELKDISNQILSMYREVKGVYDDLPSAPPPPPPDTPADTAKQQPAGVGVKRGRQEGGPAAEEHRPVRKGPLD